jgi:DNA-binding response OmpR family regulator
MDDGPPELILSVSLMTHPNSLSRQHTVLLVEDDDLVLDAMTRMLVREGYLVLTAASGHDAISLLHTPLQPINVVVLDVNLPDVSGIDLCARIRELHPSMPVVVCTGSTNPLDLAELLRMGVSRCFHKPVPMADLLASVEAAMPCAG